jgi:hypothetical protein
MFSLLADGGSLLLQPHTWESYIKKNNMTQETQSNYRKIEFKVRVDDDDDSIPPLHFPLDSRFGFIVDLSSRSSLFIFA